MILSKLKENVKTDIKSDIKRYIKTYIKTDIKTVLNEKKKLMIQIPRNNIKLKIDNYIIKTPEIKHQEIEFNC
jgi:hypothetical protein